MIKIALTVLLISSTAVSADVIGKVIFTDAFICTSTNGEATRHYKNWGNITGADLSIVKIQIWNGLDYNSRSDVTEIVIRHNDGSILIDGGHDDYDQGSSRIQREDWGGNLFRLPAGDSLDFYYGCSQGNTTHQGGWAVTIWYLVP